MKKSNLKANKKLKNKKIKRVSGRTNRGCRYVFVNGSLVPFSWYNKGDLF